MFRSLFKTILRGAPRMYFAKLLRWDLLIYVRYNTVLFVALCHFIPSVCVFVCVCLVFLTEKALSMTRLTQ
jgi:hypothetical protein